MPKTNFRNSFLPLSHPAVWFLSWAFIMSPSTPANFRLLPSNTHCILSHWNGSSGFSVHSSLPAKRPNTSHSAWQNQLTDQFSSSSASRPSRLYNGAAYEPAWNHRIIRNHFKPDFYLAPDHLSKFHYGLPTADLSCWSVLPLHIPSPVRLHQPRKWI